jgi:glycosyltransferase involved in cell wall biosynthesis
MSLISIVVPTHNESANVTPLYSRLKAVFDNLPGDDFELIFCDDSRDSTPQLIAQLHESDPRVKLIRLSRRFGQAIAVTAGIDRATGEALIMMDADLQDPPESIPLLLDQWRQGNEIVYVQRPSESTYALYKLFSYVFYRLLRKVASVEIPVDAGEFRLLDRKVVRYLQNLTEHTRYLRGLTILPGFRQTGIQIQRAPRLQGQTNYNFKRSLLVAIDGILSFSIVPVRLATLLGCIMTASAFLVAIGYIIWRFLDPTIFGAGWPSLFVAILLFAGIQLIVLGILGEYIARIFIEVQNRPVYWVDYELGFAGRQSGREKSLNVSHESRL